MRNELKHKKARSNKCMGINIDHSSNEGTHWTSLFKKIKLVFILIHTDLNPH